MSSFLFAVARGRAWLILHTSCDELTTYGREFHEGRLDMDCGLVMLKLMRCSMVF